MSGSHPNVRKVRGRYAFTLIEVLVVVAIIALLISVLMPSLARARAQSRVAVCLANLKQCGNGFGTYTADHKGRLPMRGGYTYNIKEPDVYFIKNAYKKNVRAAVNYGLLYGKYTGKEGQFYYCPGNLQNSFANPNNGWPTFHLKSNDTTPGGGTANITWGGYAYAAPVLPGNSPVEDPAVKGALTPGMKVDAAAPGSWKQATQPGSGGNEGLQARHYGEWLVEQFNSGKQPYVGKMQALMTDQLIGSGFSHLNGGGQNVLFTDYHARWVQDPTAVIPRIKTEIGIGSGMGGQLGMFAAWNWLSRRN